VQSRIKKLKKFELVEVPRPAGPIHVVIPAPERSGLVVLSLTGAVAGYGGPPVLGGVDLEVRRGDRVALVGPNGVGKSTLMSVLAGEKPLDAGERKEGHNVVLGCFEQESARMLNGSLAVLETAREKAPAEFRPQLRGLLGAFGFSGDDVYKKVEVLSGGERSRLAILTLLLTRPNVLLLDEPTNHLDMKTKDVLLAALEQFSGAVVFVSHDRYFMNELSTRVVEISDGRITDYPGNYEDYLWRKGRAQEPQVAGKQARETKGKKLSPGRQAWEERKAFASRKRRAQKKAEMLQEKIGRLESQVKEAQTGLQELYSRGEHAEAGKLAKKHAALKTELEESYLEWERAEDELGQASQERSG
jgi:ATP-binding cassette subfamily F protein 3